MKAIYKAVTIDKARQFTVKKTGEVKTVTPAAIDGRAVELPGNGLAPFTPVLVLGDLRTFEGRSYFADEGEVKIVPVDGTLELSTLLELAGAGK